MMNSIIIFFVISIIFVIASGIKSNLVYAIIGVFFYAVSVTLALQYDEKSKLENPMRNIKSDHLEYFIRDNKSIDSIKIYKEHGEFYSVDINNISYDNIPLDSLKLAVKIYPKSIYSSSNQ